MANTSNNEIMRSRPGRPPIEDKRRNRSVKATDDEWTKIQDYATELGFKSASDYLRHSGLLVSRKAWSEIKKKAEKKGITVPEYTELLQIIALEE